MKSNAAQYLEIAKQLWLTAKVRSKDTSEPYELVDLWIRIKAVEELLINDKNGVEKEAAFDAAEIEAQKLAWDSARLANLKHSDEILKKLTELEIDKKGSNSPKILQFLETLSS